MLVEEYRKILIGWGIVSPGETKEFRRGGKDALPSTLSVAATDETLAELIVVAKDRTRGESHVLLLSALKNAETRTRWQSRR